MQQKDAIETAKTSKEIIEIASEYNKTKELLEQCRWDELQRHIQHITEKYLLEATAYNAVHPFPPQSLQENAQNCLAFLDTLATAKAANTARDVLKND